MIGAVAQMAETGEIAMPTMPDVGDDPIGHWNETRDRVLYLKHNLNARAIASLEGDLVSIRSDVEKLIREMNASIAEADAFLGTLGA